MLFVMKRRRILLMAGALVAVVVVCWPSGPRDPIYNGKRLSQWLAETNKSKPPDLLTEGAIQAVKAIGTNAVPYLLSLFERGGGPEWLERLKQGKFVSRTLGIRFEPKWVRKSKAISALAWLGPDAVPPLPTLARYFDDPERGGSAVGLVALTGAAGLPYLLKALSSPNQETVAYAIYQLRAYQIYGKLELPVILELTNHDNEKARAFAFSALKYHPPM